MARLGREPEPRLAPVVRPSMERLGEAPPIARLRLRPHALLVEAHRARVRSRRRPRLAQTEAVQPALALARRLENQRAHREPPPFFFEGPVRSQAAAQPGWTYPERKVAGPEQPERWQARPIIRR